MLRNYAVTALRALRRHPGYTALTVAGLALGFGVALLLLNLTWTLVSFDRFHERAGDIYFALIDMDAWSTTSTWAPLADALEADFPGVEAATQLYYEGHQIAAEGDEPGQGRSFQHDVLYTDPDFFTVFSFPLVEGSAATALARPDAVLVTQSTARTLFGDAPAMGRTVVLDGRDPLVVTGVLADPPAHSSIQFTLVASFDHARSYSGRARAISDDWELNYLGTYLRLRPGSDAAALEARLPTFLATYRADTQTPDFRLRLAPLVQRTQSQLAQITDAQSRLYVYAGVMALLAIGILGLACINFTNMATARSMERAREIGMRKVLGASPGRVAVQFLCEALIVTFLALALGVALAQSLLPAFNELLGGLVRLQFDFAQPLRWLALLGLGLGVGVLAGAYPALFLARFRPTHTLKGRLTTRPAGARLRSGLVVLQFALTAFLLAATAGMNRQMQFVHQTGFSVGPEPLVVVPISDYAFDTPEAGFRHLATFARELRRSPEVATVALSSAAPGGEHWSSVDVATQPEAEPVAMHATLADTSFFAAFDVALRAGRHAQRTGEVVLSETAVRALGQEAALGATVYAYGRSFTVVGLAADIHFASLRQAIRPEAYFLLDEQPGAYQFLAVRAAGQQAAPVIERLHAAWPALDAAQGFTYVLADAYFGQQHALEGSLTRLLSFASGFALLIALLGLVGIAALSVAQRTKEIGVRKVMGASTGRLAVRLSRRFAVLVVLALALGLPLAFWALRLWLEGFAYRIPLGAATFALPALALLTAALLTVSTQTVRAARTDPARSLRYE